MNLKDQLTQEGALKFQLNKFDEGFIERILNENSEGIFNLPSRMKEQEQNKIMDYIKRNYSGPNYEFQLEERGPSNPINPMIYFKKY